MKTRRWFLLVIALLAPMLMAARCGDTKIVDGNGRGFISNVDGHKNGAWSIWFSDDTLIGYCTNDEALGLEAKRLLREHHGEVYYTYKDLKIMSDDEYNFWQSSACGKIGASESGTEMVKLLSLEAMPSRYMGR